MERINEIICMVEVDTWVKMPPKKSYKVELEIKNIRKGELIIYEN